jgi:serine/threonine-protein kinase
MTSVGSLDQISAAVTDRYRVEREVGRGGMATVFLAHDRKHHRPVALKVLHPHLSANLGPERFLREIQIAAGLQHPHIVPLYDSGQASGLERRGSFDEAPCNHGLCRGARERRLAGEHLVQHTTQ